MTETENNENQQQLVETPPKTARDPSLTLKARRRAGSDHCLNCGTALQGPFCHYCGQPDKRFKRFFPVMIRELLEDIADFDSRFTRTLKPLLWQPGKLTRDYIDGRRFRYTPPIRIYLFSSLGFFLLLTLFSLMVSGDNLFEVTTVNGDTQVRLNTGDPEAETREALETARQALDDANADPATRAMVEQALERHAEGASQRAAEAAAEPEAAGDAETETPAEPNPEDELPWYERPGNDLVLFDNEPWHPVDNPLDLPLVPASVDQWINTEIERSPEKGQMISENPRVLISEVIDALPITIFVLLPLFALILKLFYLFARRYYVEHLIFSLHNHSFIFVIFILLLSLGGVEWLSQQVGLEWGVTVSEWLSVAVLVWIPVYLFIAMKRVYQQGWFLTTVKYLLVGFTYINVLGMATVVVAAISFLRV